MLAAPLASTHSIQVVSPTPSNVTNKNGSRYSLMSPWWAELPLIENRCSRNNSSVSISEASGAFPTFWGEQRTCPSSLHIPGPSALLLHFCGCSFNQKPITLHIGLWFAESLLSQTGWSAESLTLRGRLTGGRGGGESMRNPGLVSWLSLSLAV